MPATDDAAAPPEVERPRVALPLLLAAGGLYQSLLALSQGTNDPTSLLSGWPLFAACGVVIALIVAGLVRTRSTRDAGGWAVGVAGVALVAQAICGGISGWFSFEFYNGQPTPAAFRTLPAAAGPILAVAGMAMLARGVVARRLLWVLVALNLAMGCFVAARTTVGIDVLAFQQGGAEAFSTGINPYAIQYANPYHDPSNPDVRSAYYSAEVQQGGRLLFGFPYLPLSLLAVMPSYLLTGEVRYAHAVALAAAGALVAACARGRAGRCAAVLALTAPAGWQVVMMSWTEPFLMLTLGLVAIAAVRGWRWLPVCVGLFLASKQYTVIYLPLLFLLLPRPLAAGTSLRFLAIAAATAAIVTLPLALWDLRAFWHSAFAIQLAQPFRIDSLSFLSLYAQQTGGPPPMASAIAFAAIVPAWILTFAFAPRNVAGFTLGVALTTVAFLFFNRQAFLNYHTFAAYAVLLSVALLEAQRSPDDAVAGDIRLR